MPPELSPIRPSGSTPGALVPVRAPGTGATRGASAAGGIAPVAPIGPGSTAPLSRSGVAPDAVLTREDARTERAPAAPVELRVALEESRAALVRRDPVAALTALDRVWQGADQVEEGWYLRSGALAALGLAGEGATVAARGLERAPRSRALRFVLSLSRAVTGDLAGAREALQSALDDAPDDPVLLAQLAVLLERQGRSDDAARARRRLQSKWATHPATTWADDALRVARADRQRAQSRAVPDDGAADADATADDSRANDAHAARDVAIDAMSALGVTIADGDDARAIAHARQVLRAFAVDGTYGIGWAPSLAHAARTLLVTIIDLLQRGADGGLRTRPSARASTPTTTWAEQDDRAHGDDEPLISGAADASQSAEPTAAVIAHVVQLLRTGRATSGFSVRQALNRVPAPMGRWIGALLRDTPHAVAESATRTPPGGAPSHVGPGDATGVVSTLPSASDDGVLTPLRLGLSLLPESSVRTRTSGASWRTVPDVGDADTLPDGSAATDGASDDVRDDAMAQDRATRATVVQVAGSASAVAGAAVAWLAVGAWAGAALAVVAIVLAAPLFVGQTPPRRD